MSSVLSKFWSEDQRRKAMEEGRLEGEARGEAKALEKTAANAIKKGLSFELIEELTGFDIKRIKEMKEQIDKQESITHRLA